MCFFEAKKYASTVEGSHRLEVARQKIQAVDMHQTDAVPWQAVWTKSAHHSILESRWRISNKITTRP